MENVDTRATRRGMAGTQLIDGEWQELKEWKTGLNASTPAGRERLMMYFRAAQWTRFVSSRDRCSAFLADAKDYMRKHASDELLMASSLHPQVVPLRRALKTPGSLEGGAEGESARTQSLVNEKARCCINDALIFTLKLTSQILCLRQTLQEELVLSCQEVSQQVPRSLRRSRIRRVRRVRHVISPDATRFSRCAPSTST